MGSFIAQELMLARPDLVSQAVLMATRGRSDRTRSFFRTAEHDLAGAGIELPASYDAKVRLLESFSPKTLNDDAAVRDWIDMFTTWPIKPTPGLRCQLDIGPDDNRLPAYRSITTPTLVIGFADDIVLPPHFGKEVADALPNGRYRHIPNAGHLGFLERPQAVNEVILNSSPKPTCDTLEAMVNPSTAQGRIVVDELIRGGVRDVVLCPGRATRRWPSRCATPTRPGECSCTCASTNAPPATWPSASAVSAGAPVPIVMTSGTAVANLGPAVAGGRTTRACH